VEFTSSTRNGRARQPAFKGLREDKAAKEVRREALKWLDQTYPPRVV
jgi:hypothetical protein